MIALKIGSLMTWLSKHCALGLMLYLSMFSAIARDLEQDEALRLRMDGVIMPLEDLVHLALQQYPKARLLEVELEDEKGKYIYEVELLTPSGGVRELEFDARNGRLLSDEEED